MTSDTGEFAAAARRSAYSETLDLALRVASIVHRAQHRRGTQVPYVSHPVQVAMILDRHGLPEPVVVAGVLHDVLEDLDAEDHDVRHRMREVFDAEAPDVPDAFAVWVERFLVGQFGEEVVRLVRAVTEQKHENGRPLPWEVRRRRTLDHLRGAGEAEVALKAADALHNTRSIVMDLRRDGVRMMSRFNAPPEKTVWWYTSVARLVRERLGDRHALAVELDAAVTELIATVDTELSNLRQRIRDAVE